MSTRWTPRRNGVTETNIQVTYHVPQDLVVWLDLVCGWGQETALRWIRKDIAHLVDEWSCVYVNESTDEPEFASIDVVDDIAAEGGTVYEGPRVSQKQQS